MYVYMYIYIYSNLAYKFGNEQVIVGSQNYYDYCLSYLFELFFVKKIINKCAQDCYNKKPLFFHIITRINNENI